MEQFTNTIKREKVINDETLSIVSVEKIFDKYLIRISDCVFDSNDNLISFREGKIFYNAETLNEVCKFRLLKQENGQKTISFISVPFEDASFIITNTIEIIKTMKKPADDYVDENIIISTPTEPDQPTETNVDEKELLEETPAEEPTTTVEE